MSLKQAGHELFRRASESLKQDAASHASRPRSSRSRGKSQWPGAIQEFFASGDGEAFNLAGEQDDHLDYLVRRADGVAMYTTSLNGIDDAAAFRSIHARARHGCRGGHA